VHLLLCHILSVASDSSCPSVSFQVPVFRYFSGNFLFTNKSRASTEIVFSVYCALHSVIISLSETWKFNEFYASVYACVGLVLSCGVPAVYCVNTDVSEELNASL
jgi:hypothetical protein